MARLGLFFGDQSAVAVRIGTRLSSAQFALLSRSGSARWTRDCKCLCEAEVLLHVEIMLQHTAAGMVNSEQVRQFTPRCPLFEPGKPWLQLRPLQWRAGEILETKVHG
jgi:hypothetical protein